MACNTGGESIIYLVRADSNLSITSLSHINPYCGVHLVGRPGKKKKKNDQVVLGLGSSSFVVTGSLFTKTA